VRPTNLGLGDEAVAKAMLAGGIIGVFIAARSTFAAEVCGCQAECGAASAMAAGALCTLGGGTARQSVAAASMALQNSLGMICDPVANRVEELPLFHPLTELPARVAEDAVLMLAAGNALLDGRPYDAANALSCANVALGGFDPVIPLDEVIETMDRVGRALPRELRCTALGGLSITRTAKEIERRLGGRRGEWT
jgi:L-serine dehydratase